MGKLPFSAVAPDLVMSKLLRVSTLALIPAVMTGLSGLAHAHPGHTHAVSPATHHGMEALLVALAALAFVWCLRRAGVWGTSRN